MKYVGIDLHKKTISICVVNQERKKLEHKRLHCLPVETIVDLLPQARRIRSGRRGDRELRMVRASD